MNKRAEGIIILGHPRSGTTMLRRLLNGHSRIACPPETHLLSACARFLDAESTAHGVDMGVLAGLSFAGIEDDVVLEKLRNFAFSFLSDYASMQNKPRWAEKTAFDAFHIENIEQFCGDHAFYIGIVRHGLDVAISSKDFCDAAGMYPDVMHEYIRRYSQPIEAFARSWLDVNQSLLEFSERHPENCIVCRYEDIVADPANNLEKILQFVGEEFEPAMLELGFDGKEQLGFSDHKSYQAKKIHDASVSRWHSLPQQQISHLAPVINPLLERLGYAPVEAGEKISTAEARRRYTSGLKIVASRKLPEEPVAREIIPPRSPLVFYGREESIPGTTVHRISKVLDHEISNKLMTSASGGPPALVFSAALLAFMHRVTNGDNLCIGVSIPAQPDANGSGGEPVWKKISLQLVINPGGTFTDILREVDRFLQDIPSAPNPVTAADLSSFDVLLNDRSSSRTTTTDTANADSGDNRQVNGENSLTVNIERLEKEGPFLLNIDFNEGAWPDPKEQNRAVAHYLTLIQSLADNPDQVIDEVFLLTPEEQDLLLPMGQEDGSLAQRLPTVIERFIEQVSRRPDHPAVVFYDQQLTYRELGERVWMLSAFLRTRGVEPGSLVGICLNRSLDMVTALLAVMHAGGTYIPIDPEQPESRITMILEDVDPVVVVGERTNRSRLASVKSSKILFIDDGDWLSSESKASAELGDQAELAYIIFTSGSTGRPKGVEVLHHGLSAFLMAMGEQPGLNENDRLLAVTTISFDIAALEIFLPLVTGATIHITAHRDAMDGMALQDLLSKNEISIFQATPATYHILVNSGWQGNPTLKLLCGGEAFPQDLAMKLVERCGELWNMYGPTETTIWSTVQKIGDDTGRITIGRPIAGTQTYILNASLSPVPLGVSGELFIAGEGLALGYHGRSDLTAERFLANPYSTKPGARMYRTGDLVRCADGSSIEYIGRLDNQVKIRGYRIELGEIETAISDLDAVRQNVVGTYETATGTTALVAYIVQKEGTETLGLDVIREHLAPRLPGYMIPARLILMESLPLTPNNKVDRKALPKPSDRSISGQKEIPPPEKPMERPADTVEQQIIDSWKNLLGENHIVSEDSFVALGGDSLTFIQASLVLEDILGHIPDNWETLSIRELSRSGSKETVLKKVDSVVLIRALAITGVVLGHLGLGVFAGGTSALLIAAGYLFANFQLQATCSQDTSSSILSSIIRIAIPTVLYTAFLQVWVKDFHIENLLLVGNFLPPNFAGGIGEYWFLHVLVQILLILTLLLSFKVIRLQARNNPFQFGLALLVMSAIMLFAGPYIWNTDHLFNRVPHMQFWLFMIGWCIFLCDTNFKKILIAIVLVTISLPWLVADLYGTLMFTVLPGLLLLSFPAVNLLFPLNRLAHYIGGASLFIYLTHFQFTGLYDRLGLESHLLVNLVITLAGGVIVWRVWDIVQEKLNLPEWYRKLLPQR